jgi:hypothetical protein
MTEEYKCPFCAECYELQVDCYHHLFTAHYSAIKEKELEKVGRE